MVCFRCVILNTPYEGGGGDDYNDYNYDYDDNNSNNLLICWHNSHKANERGITGT